MLGEGYQIKMTNSRSLDCKGVICTPQSTLISIPSAWSILGYLRTGSGSVASMFSNIISSQTEIIKNSVGEMYYPYLGINTLLNLNPGEGYQIRVDNAESFYYPTNTKSISTGINSSLNCSFYINKNITNEDMTIMIPHNAWDIIPNIGDEIGVFDSNNILRGSTVFAGGNTAISVWGDDDLTIETDGLYNNEEFSFAVWNSMQNSTYTITIAEWEIGNNKYEKQKISIADEIISQTVKNTKLIFCEKIDVYPNPCIEKITIDFETQSNEMIFVSICDISGKIIYSIPTKSYSIASNKIIVNTKEFRKGIYTLTIQSGESKISKKFTVI